MSTIGNIRSVLSGQRKAKRDYRKILAHAKEHDRRHKAIEGYDCDDWNAAFFQSVRRPTDIDRRVNSIEEATYGVIGKGLQEKLMTKLSGGTPDSGITLSSLAVEVDGTESGEQVIDKIMRAVKTRIDFDAMDVEGQVSETKKKGGKK